MTNLMPNKKPKAEIKDEASQEDEGDDDSWTSDNYYHSEAHDIDEGDR